MSLFSQIDGLKYELSKKNRKEIRQSLFEAYGHDSLLDLSKFPNCTSPYISISHTKDCSGWVSHPVPIGFDIESSSRDIDSKTLLRVSSDEEFNEAPSALALWVAKEAAFKSLWRYEKPQLLSQIHVSQWSRFNSKLFQYKYCNINDLGAPYSGWLEPGDRFTLGIALRAPQL